MLFDPFRGRMSLVDNGFLLIYYPDGIKERSMFFRFLITPFANAKSFFRNDKCTLLSKAVAYIYCIHEVYLATGSKGDLRRRRLNGTLI